MDPQRVIGVFPECCRQAVLRLAFTNGQGQCELLKTATRCISRSAETVGLRPGGLGMVSAQLARQAWPFGRGQA
jgi:hypothetical protein